MLCGLFAESIAALVLYVVSIMVAVIISVLYSYLFYKKKIETGEKLKIQYKKKAIVRYGIVTILTIIFINLAVVNNYLIFKIALKIDKIHSDKTFS